MSNFNGHRYHQRPTSTNKNAIDMSTPRASNHSHFTNNAPPSMSTSNHDRSYRDSKMEIQRHYHYTEESDQQPPHVTKSSQKAMKHIRKRRHFNSQHQQKAGQEYPHPQLLHHHSSEERQSTSGSFRADEICFITEREDVSERSCTPSSVSPQFVVQKLRNYPRVHEQSLTQSQYYINDPLQYTAMPSHILDSQQLPECSSNSINDYSDRSSFRAKRIQRSLSTGAFEMIGHSMNYRSPYSITSNPVGSTHAKTDVDSALNRCSIDDNCLTLQYSDVDQESFTKKKISKGIFSRASHKIKKRLVSSGIGGGSFKEKKNGKDYEILNNFSIVEIDGGVGNSDAIADTCYMENTNDFDGVESFIQRGREPSPSDCNSDRRLRRNHLLLDGGWKNVKGVTFTECRKSEEPEGVVFDDDDTIQRIDPRPSADLSVEDDSTLSSHFTHLSRNLNEPVEQPQQHWSKQKRNNYTTKEAQTLTCAAKNNSLVDNFAISPMMKDFQKWEEIVSSEMTPNMHPHQAMTLRTQTNEQQLAEEAMFLQLNNRKTITPYESIEKKMNSQAESEVRLENVHYQEEQEDLRKQEQRHQKKVSSNTEDWIHHSNDQDIENIPLHVQKEKPLILLSKEMGCSDMHGILMKELLSKKELVMNDNESITNGNAWYSKSSEKKCEINEQISMEFSKLQTDLIRENTTLSKEIDNMKRELTDHENQSASLILSISQMENKIKKLETDLHKKERELSRMIQEKTGAAEEIEKSNNVLLQLNYDLDAYKKECTNYREKILQLERDNTMMEKMLYSEKSKVLSLESENEMLLNVADERIGRANNAERAKQLEMNAYKDECKKYRDRLIQLERKVITVESALESTGKMASALELEKKNMSETLDQMTHSNNITKAELKKKETELHLFQEELSTLRSKWILVEKDTTNNLNELSDNQETINGLVSEKSNLIQKLEAQSLALKNQENVEIRNKQLELENNSLKKMNDELKVKDVELREQLIDAQSRISNLQRVQKMLNDSEAFISSLQNDLSQTRSKHHQQLLELRGKHSAECDDLSVKLQSEQFSRRDAEMRNKELEDKVLCLEKMCANLEQQRSLQTKAQSDQIATLMNRIEDVRHELSESEEKVSSLKQDIAKTTYEQECLANELRRNVISLEQQLSETTDTIETLENNLSAKVKVNEKLQEEITEKDKELLHVRDGLTEANQQKASEIYELNQVTHRIKRELESITSENLSLSQQLMTLKKAQRKQDFLVKRCVADTMKSVKVERAKVETELIQQKTQLSKYVKDLLLEYNRRIGNHQLNQSMKHQVAFTNLHSEKNEIEVLLNNEKVKTYGLQNTLDKLKDEKEALMKTLNAACNTLCVQEKDLVDKIEDMQIDVSNANSEIATLSLDLTAAKSELTNLKHAKHQLTLQLEQIRDESTALRLKFNDIQIDYNDQIEKGQSVIACLELTIASNEKEWIITRSSLEDEITSIQSKLKEEVSLRESQLDELRTENNEIRSHADKLKQEYEDLGYEVNESRRVLQTLKASEAFLHDQLREKTDTIHNLTELLSRASRESTDELADHYMKIEEQLRAQLHSVQSERDSMEKKMTFEKEMTERKVEESNRSKEEMAACVKQHLAELDTAKAEMNMVKSQLMAKDLDIEDLKRKNNALHEKVTNLSEEINLLTVERDSSAKNIQNLMSTIEKLNTALITSEHESAAELARITDELIQKHSAEINRLNNDLSDSKWKIANLEDNLKDAHAEHSCDLQLSIEFYKTELEKEKSKYLKDKQVKDHDITKLNESLDEITREKSSLELSVKSLQDKVKEYEVHIQELKIALKNALEEALQADVSKRDSLVKLADITELATSYEEEYMASSQQLKECNSILNGSDIDHPDLKSSIEQLLVNKSGIDFQLTETKRRLLESQFSLTQIKHKLADTQHMMNMQSKESQAEISQLKNALKFQEDERKELIDMHKASVSQLRVELEMMEKSKQETEEELVRQLMVLKQDCEVENLYKELLEKLKGKEMKYEARIQKMTADMKNVEFQIECLSCENKELVHARNDAIALNNELNNQLSLLQSEFCALQKSTAKDIINDEVSTTSTRTSHQLHQTASELEQTIRAIKNHHNETIQKLQAELEETRSRLKKSEQKVNDLTNLLHENSSVINALHKKLMSKKQRLKGATSHIPSTPSTSSTSPSSLSYVP